MLHPTKKENPMLEKEPSDEARKSALESDYAALYAVAGLTDALAEALKGALAETQQKASKRLNELQSKRPELSKQANGLLAQATNTYADFAGRGKEAVDDVRRSARDRSPKATKPVTPRSTDVSAVSGPAAGMSSESGAVSGVSSDNGPVSGMSSESAPASGVSSDNGPATGMRSESAPASGVSSDNGPASGMSSESDRAFGR